MRLNATDISDRTSSTTVLVEANSDDKSSRYSRTETDLSVELGGTTVALIRAYDSLSHHHSGSFGNGWRLANVDTDIQTNVEDSDRSSLGIYEPFRIGTRLYLTAPSGERVGFTFNPQKQEIPGLTYYTPVWVPDASVDYTLQSATGMLTLGGSRLYDLKTAHAYNPASGEFDSPEYTLTSLDGSVYYLSTNGGVEEQFMPNGTHLIYSDSGITTDTGETIRFVKDELGRLTEITTSDGSSVIYTYEDSNLIAARNLTLGQSSRYGYSEGEEQRLTLAVD